MTKSGVCSDGNIYNTFNSANVVVETVGRGHQYNENYCGIFNILKNMKITIFSSLADVILQDCI